MPAKLNATVIPYKDLPNLDDDKELDVTLDYEALKKDLTFILFLLGLTAGFAMGMWILINNAF